MRATEDLKEVLLESIDAFLDWKPGYPEPTIHAEGNAWPISRLCAALVSCKDAMSDDACRFLGLEAGSTYDRGAAALQEKFEAARRFNNARPTGFKGGLIMYWRDCEAKAESFELHRLLSEVAAMSFEEFGQYC
jgi:hypothetical protein